MEEVIKQKLVTYYCDSLLSSYIYSENIKSYLELRDITCEDWFLEFMKYNIEHNKENNIFGTNERYNCYHMINRLLLNSLDNHDVEKLERCNELIAKLNCSTDENEYEYLAQLYISNSPNPRIAEKLIDRDMIDLDTVKRYFGYANQLCFYLLKEEENNEDSDDNIINLDPDLLNNEYVIFSIIEISREIPEVLTDVDAASKMFAIIYGNQRIIKSKKVDIKNHKYAVEANKNAIKVLKKSFKRAQINS